MQQTNQMKGNTNQNENGTFSLKNPNTKLQAENNTNNKMFNGQDKVNQNGGSSNYTDIFKTLALIVEIKSESLLYAAIVKSKQVLNDLKSELKSMNAELVMEPKVLIRHVGHAVEQVSWTNQIQLLLKDYEVSRLKEKTISIPSHLRNEKEMNDLKNHMKRFAETNNSLRYEVNGSECVKVVGYIKVVDLFYSDVKSKFNNLDNNIRDRIRRKLDLSINKKSNSDQFQILSGFKGLYFNIVSFGRSK